MRTYFFDRRVGHSNAVRSLEAIPISALVLVHEFPTRDSIMMEKSQSLRSWLGRRISTPIEEGA